MDRKLTGALLFAVIGLFIITIKPFTGSGLDVIGHEVLGTVLIALGLWVFKPRNVPLLAGSSVVIFGSLAFFSMHSTYAGAEAIGIVANGFVSSSVWTLIPALYFGFVLQKTGLGKRLAYMVLKAFKPSWTTMAFSWLLIGVILSVLTPSITVRVAIVVPIAISIVEACKLEYRSKGSAFVTLLAWGMCLMPGAGWLTGSLSGPIIVGLLPADMKVFATNAEWIRILGPPWMTVTIVFVVLSLVFMKPARPIGIDIGIFRDGYQNLGPVTRSEQIALLTLLGCFILFFTESIHGIPTPATAMCALFVFIITGIIEPPELNTGINWDVVLFFGVAVGLSQIFRSANVTSWIEPALTPFIMSLAPSPFVFMPVITIGLMLIRFIDVPWGYTTAALTAGLTSVLYHCFGYHPLVVCMAFLTATNFFFLSYQQPWILMADDIIRRRGWASGHLSLFGCLYIVSVLISLSVSIPYWKAIGVLV